MREEKPLGPWRARMHEVIFEADTPAGRNFDLFLLGAILISVTAAVLESVASIRAEIGPQLRFVEWFFTILFTIEYILRLVCVGRPIRYALSFFGIVDLLSIIPTWASLIWMGSQGLLVVRTFRLLRVFRIFKLAHFLGEANLLQVALRASVPKIIVFLGAVFSLVLIVGASMYLIEGEENGFTSIPQSVYWAIVTMTTVGYGDIAPNTVFGRIFASLVMIVGYGIIAVPTGIVSAEFAHQRRTPGVSRQACPQCSLEGHAPDATFCKHCAAKL